MFVKEICRSVGSSQPTSKKWRSRLSGIEPPDGAVISIQFLDHYALGLDLWVLLLLS